MHTGRITKIYPEGSGWVKNSDSEIPGYTIYFNNGIGDIKVGDIVKYTIKKSKSDKLYAVFHSLAEVEVENEDVVGNDPFAKYKTVSQINNNIKETLQGLASVCVKGEVTNYSKRDYNHYFDLKEVIQKRDKNVTELINCVLWENNAERNLNFDLKSGLQIGVVGDIGYYSGQSRAQINVKRIAEIGQGAERLALLQLMERLREEGLFDRKRPFPMYPKKIGIVTSAAGKAKDDILVHAKKLNKFVLLELCNVNVQGQNAEASIVEGIRYMDSRGYDVLIVGRGGGSEEDLSCFNSELIARAVFATNTPVVAAVGHATDEVLINNVADYYVITPTAAVDLLLERYTNVIYRIDKARETLQRSIEIKHERLKSMLSGSKLILEKLSPKYKLMAKQHKLASSRIDLQRNIEKQHERLKTKLSEKKRVLESLNPQNKLIIHQHRLESAKFDLQRNIEKQHERLKTKLSEKKRVLESLNPQNKLMAKQHKLASSRIDLQRNITNIFNKKKMIYISLTEKLHGLSPTAKLINGFGYISSEFGPINSVESVNISDKVAITIHDGEIVAVVENIIKKNIKEEN